MAPTPPASAAEKGLGPAPVTSLDYVHQPFGDGACGVCHDLQGPDPTKLWGDVDQVCLQCHWQEVQAPNAAVKVPHQPFAEGKCVECHLPHAGPNPNLLVKAPTELCNGCHQDHGKIVDQTHPSVAKGECNLCHLAHGSDHPAMMRLPQREVCGTCHKDQIDPTISAAAHANAEEIQCSTCHDPHNAAKELPAITRELCVTCHTQLPDPTSLEHPHQPYMDGRCADCHPSFHRNPDFPMQAATQSAACNKCHEDHGEQVNQIHPSVAKGECLLCHDGHGSDEPQHLVKAEDEICRTCHADQFDVKRTFAAHQADKLPACSSCHSPHEPKLTGRNVAIACSTCHQDVIAGASQHMPVKEGECKNCHPQFHGDKPTQLAAVSTECTDCHKLDTGPVKHPPYQTGDCESCHLPHASAQVSLLSKAPTQLCGSCHRAQVASFGTSQHATRVKAQCAACHVAHNGSVDNLLVARANAVCESCHKDLPHGFHPVSGGKDPVRGGELSCISCHSPHGSSHPADLRASGDALCLTCHQFDQPPVAQRQ